jgi:hypothetical protein
MSVYTDLVKLGVTEDTARALAEVVARPQPVTTDYLDKRLAELEARLLRHTTTVLLGVTGIFAFFVVASSAWLGWLIATR